MQRLKIIWEIDPEPFDLELRVVDKASALMVSALPNLQPLVGGRLVANVSHHCFFERIAKASVPSFDQAKGGSGIG